MAKIKALINFLKKPSKRFSFVVYFFTFLFAILSLFFMDTIYVNYVLYSLLGITFFYSVYLFVIFFNKYRDEIKETNEKIFSKTKFTNRLYLDYDFRTIVFAIWSLIISLAFSIYNIIVGICYDSLWHLSIFLYYFLLVVIRLMLIIRETAIKRKNLDNSNLRRFQLYRDSNILLLILDFVLIAPITLLVLFQKDVFLPFWVAIINAGYTFYKTILSTYNFFKTRKYINYSIRAFKNINFIDSLISILSLTNTLIIVNSVDAIDNNMKIMTAIVGLSILIISILISIIGLTQSFKGIKTNKNITYEDNN